MRIQKQPPQEQQQRSPSLSELELFTARSGMLSARLNRPGGLHHLHSAVKPEEEAGYWGDTEFWGDLIVFLGTGLGYHVGSLLKNVPPGSRLLLVDFYPQLIEHCRTNIFGGLPQPIAAISSSTTDWRAAAAQASGGAQSIQIVKHAASYQANKGFYDAVLNALCFKRIPKSAGGPALLFYGSFFLEEELRRALSRSAQGLSLFNYNECGAGAAAFESALSRHIQRERPQFILSVNMKGFDSTGIVADISARFGVPVIVWFVDDPHPIVLPQKPFVKNHMIALCWERSYLPWLLRQGFGAARYLPLAADPTLFSPGAERGLLAEIGFVGSAMGGAFLEELAGRFLWRKELEPLVRAAAEALCADKTLPPGRLVQQTCRRLGVALPFSDDKNITWLCSFIMHTASMLQRKELVGACMPLGIATFGDPAGWRALLGDSLRTHPDVDYRSGLSHVYRSIGINVNITSRQMPRAVNQRAFDIPLCGGFVLNDRQTDLEELFAPDEIAVYDSKETLIDKLKYFHEHAAERNALTQKARARILAEHTYDHRIAALKKFLPEA